MKSNNFVFRRVYDYCIDDTEKTQSRGYIRRSNRVPLMIFITILVTIFEFVFYSLNLSHFGLFSLFMFMVILYFSYVTRTGFISHLNIFRLNKVLKRKDKTVLDKIILSFNDDETVLNIQDKYLRKIKDSKFNWLKYILVFSNSRNVCHEFVVSRKSIILSIKVGKISILNRQKITVIRFPVDRFKDIHNIDEIILWIRNKFREINGLSTI